MIEKSVLEMLYFQEGKSQQEIALLLKCSLNQVAYWMKNYGLKTRSISQAVYQRRNPGGDPFRFHLPTTMDEAFLYGLGFGLYWGEGTKANLGSVRLGNTDARLIKAFMRFLVELFGVEKRDFRFSLQIFSDIDKNVATRYWVRALGVDRSQFTKPTITPYRSLGTYRKKSRYGVATVYYHNTRLRNLVVEHLSKIDDRAFLE